MLESNYYCTCKSNDIKWRKLTATTLLGAKRQASQMYDRGFKIELAERETYGENNYEYRTLAIKHINAKSWTTIH